MAHFPFLLKFESLLGNFLSWVRCRAEGSVVKAITVYISWDVCSPADPNFQKSVTFSPEKASERAFLITAATQQAGPHLQLRRNGQNATRLSLKCLIEKYIQWRCYSNLIWNKMESFWKRAIGIHSWSLRLLLDGCLRTLYTVL